MIQKRRLEESRRKTEEKGACVDRISIKKLTHVGTDDIATRNRIVYFKVSLLEFSAHTEDEKSDHARIMRIRDGVEILKIRTKRLTIRNFTADDWKALQEMIIQKESSEYAIYDHEWPTTEKEIRSITEWFASGNRFLAVCLNKTGKLIGFISLGNPNGEVNREFDLGFCLNFNYHGKGYATEGCKAVVKYAFSELKAEKVTCSTAAANTPSCNLLNRLGMKKTGEGTASFRKTFEGKPIEFAGLTFTILRDGWVKANT